MPAVLASVSPVHLHSRNLGPRNGRPAFLEHDLHPSQNPEADNEKGKSSHQEHSKDYQSNTDASVPAPLPDTGAAPPNPNKNIATVLSSLVPVESAPISTVDFWSIPSTLTVKPTFSPSPQMSKSAAIASASTTVSNSSGQPNPTRHLSTSLIAGITSGVAILFLVVCVTVKVLLRPRPKVRPTPSLPILKEDYPDEKVSDDPDSPIFGGKERFSQRSNAGLLDWTPYPHAPELPRPIEAAHAAVKSPKVPSYFQYSASQNNGDVTSKTQGGRISIKAPIRPHANTRPQSPSIYPVSSPVIDHATASEGGKRQSVPVAGAQAKVTLVKTGGLAENSRRQSVFAYDGADVASPNLNGTELTPLPKSITASSSGGRMRIRSAYFATGPYPHASLMTNSKSTKDSVSDSYFGPAKTETKSPARRERDTKALTSALGLESTTPSSPQTTIYPEDSMSAVINIGNDDRETTPPMPKLNKENDAGSALGNLMLREFGNTSKSLVGLKRGHSISRIQPPSISSEAQVKDFEAGSISKSKSQKSVRSLRTVDDKPPRVPSPPTLPSLAQMSLEHAHPEAYSDYRSPTYSIYGLYEGSGDRKSRTRSVVHL